MEKTAASWSSHYVKLKPDLFIENLKKFSIPIYFYDDTKVHSLITFDILRLIYFFEKKITFKLISLQSPKSFTLWHLVSGWSKHSISNFGAWKYVHGSLWQFCTIFGFSSKHLSLDISTSELDIQETSRDLLPSPQVTEHLNNFFIERCSVIYLS